VAGDKRSRVFIEWTVGGEQELNVAVGLRFE